MHVLLGPVHLITFAWRTSRRSASRLHVPKTLLHALAGQSASRIRVLYRTAAFQPRRDLVAKPSLTMVDSMEKIPIGRRATCLDSFQAWTTIYKLSFSNDHSNWRVYRENNAEKVFNGNFDTSTVVKNYLADPTSTKFVRFIVAGYFVRPIMTVELYGPTP
ncbi:predicted protein [Nematostella vectensis]|uniref:F5/8 type C domain-containing protein n=1 Tax=Nematostella vectensis TaxID=45351 RepID=A7RQB9_NEMVE|nr:predicted protein [Nematostella vectensis]|eukprot:XP_001638328.1 predicted protein [Nematostella vectensis]